MSKRRRSNTQPEYIHLQPYRALVGVPMKARRFGTIHAFVVGTIKGIMWSAVPVAAAVVALAYQAHGWSDLTSDLGKQVSLAGATVGAIGVITGMIAAARR